MQMKLFCCLFLWLCGLSVGAQKGIYVCQQDVCEVFDVHHVESVNFLPGTFCIGAFPPYDVQHVDSIVFSQPALTDLRERGWWGSDSDGELRYRARLVVPDLGYDYEVCYYFEMEQGICMSARCIVLTPDKTAAEKMMVDNELFSSDTNDSYIYVKQTQTGPRKYERWVMGCTQIFPCYCLTTVEDKCLVASLSVFLGQRRLSELKTIVEAWVHQPAEIVMLVQEGGMPVPGHP